MRNSSSFTRFSTIPFERVFILTFQQLLYIVEINRCGSINKAAQKLFLSQSGISAAVKELEEEMGLTFFKRSNRGVEPTQEGKEFICYAVSLLEQKRRIESLYMDSPLTAAPVRFTVATQRYPFTEDAFLRFLQTAEQNRFLFTIKEAGMDVVIDDVYDRRADVGVIFLTELTDHLIGKLLSSRELEFHELASVPPCIYVRRGHPLAAWGSVEKELLQNYPYLSFEHDEGVAVDFSEEYQLLSSKKPARCIQVNNRTTAMNILGTTDAFTTGSGLMAESLSDPRIITLRIKDCATIRLGWIRAKNSRSSPEIERFLTLLKASVADSIRFTEDSQKEYLCQE